MNGIERAFKEINNRAVNDKGEICIIAKENDYHLYKYVLNTNVEVTYTIKLDAERNIME